MALFTQTSINFNDPDDLIRLELDPAAHSVFDSALTERTLDTTASFTSLTTQGLADTTNWTTDTFKSLLSVSEPGELVGIIGPTLPTAGQILTVEITVDGVVSTIPITTSNNTKRPALLATGPMSSTVFTTASRAMQAATALSSDKRTLIPTAATSISVPTWPLVSLLRPPLLAWKNSLLIRAKTSVAITNSVATAWSAVIYRLKGGTT